MRAAQDLQPGGDIHRHRRVRDHQKEAGGVRERFHPVQQPGEPGAVPHQHGLGAAPAAGLERPGIDDHRRGPDPDAGEGVVRPGPAREVPRSGALPDFRKSISVGKKVRTETGVNKGCVSVGSAAVELAESKLGSLQGKNVLVIGAGRWPR